MNFSCKVSIMASLGIIWAPKGFFVFTPKASQEDNWGLRNSPATRRAQEEVLVSVGAVVIAAVREETEPEPALSGEVREQWWTFALECKNPGRHNAKIRSTGSGYQIHTLKKLQKKILGCQCESWRVYGIQESQTLKRLAMCFQLEKRVPCIKHN